MKKTLIEKIDSLIKERSILNHPFYQAWQNGTLERADLQKYAKQYYFHVSAFPQYLSAVHSKMDDADDRKLMLENLLDEEVGKNNHPKLWKDFAKELNVTDGSIKKEKALPKTRETVNHFKQITREGSIAEGIAALYAYESQIPKVSQTKIKGLKKFYGVTTKKGLKYFSEHMKADIRHSEAEQDLIKKYSKGISETKILKAVSQTLDAYWNLLSGIQKSF